MEIIEIVDSILSIVVFGLTGGRQKCSGILFLYRTTLRVTYKLLFQKCMCFGALGLMLD